MARWNSAPKIFFVQFDDCTPQNMSRFVFESVQLLLFCNQFKQGEIRVLSVGQMREDKGQTTKKTSRLLKSKDTITLTNFHDVLRKTSERHFKLTHLRRILKWSTIRETRKLLTIVSSFSPYQYIMIFQQWRKIFEGTVATVQWWVKSSCMEILK